MGTATINLTEGLSNADPLDAQINIAMISVAKEVIVVADHRKVGQVHFAPVAPITAVHKLVIDHGVSPEEIKAFEEKGIEVIIARQEVVGGERVCAERRGVLASEIDIGLVRAVM